MSYPCTKMEIHIYFPEKSLQRFDNLLIVDVSEVHKMKGTHKYLYECSCYDNKFAHNQTWCHFKISKLTELRPYQGAWFARGARFKMISSACGPTITITFIICNHPTFVVLVAREDCIFKSSVSFHIFPTAIRVLNIGII